MTPGRALLAMVLLLQAVLGFRVVSRLARTASGSRIAIVAVSGDPVIGCSVIVPVLNESARLSPCLAGLSAAGPEVREILVVDGGSDDGTQRLIGEWTARDARIRTIDASPVPADWNGKAWGLQAGFDRSDPANSWILTMDADVRPAPGLVPALIAHAQAEDVVALSAATRQTLSGAAEGIVHPAMLATLVYRFGIPGQATNRVAETQANGQCFLARRDALARSGGFAAVRGSLSEDVTLARSLVAAGGRVGFYETDGLVSVAMYTGWRDAWVNWTRSLPLRDQYWGAHGPLGLAEIVAAQALPVPVALVLRRVAMRPGAGRLPRLGWRLNAVLAVTRFGVLAGMSRAYDGRPWTYWLSPLADVPVAAALIVSAARRTHRWRGRVIERREPGAPGAWRHDSSDANDG